ncbi:uncharacterized protein LOC134686298 [Mytilus trossulus]|uniref:uncharacterized protein LOC134686298 n=1 Tax=Mytilus trossulus TaxID=6551 RepID=UPI003006C422
MANATERVNTALAALRTELSDMRNQDVQLMKQLMNINNSIQQLTKKQKSSKRSKGSKSQKTNFKEMIRTSTLSKIDEDSTSSSSESDYESDTSSDEEIFRTNVKLWKYSQSSEDSD